MVRYRVPGTVVDVDVDADADVDVDMDAEMVAGMIVRRPFQEAG